MSYPATNNEHYLRGLDGSNPLAFLAALGTLQTATRVWGATAVRMHWVIDEGAWKPILSVPDETDERSLAETLHRELANTAPSAAFRIADNLTMTASEFRKNAAEAQYTTLNGKGRRYADFITAFGCDAAFEKNTGSIHDTALRTMSGAGHQDFLKFMRTLEEVTTREHLHSSLFEPWRYEDAKPSLRWDSADDRRYALRWRDPSKDQITTVRGANRLAIEGLPLLPTMPDDGALATTGFLVRGKRRIEWSWPVWETALSADVCRSMLSLLELQFAEPPMDRLHALGVGSVYRSRRISIGKYRNFSPAEAVG